jgi:hypothetical protein
MGTATLDKDWPCLLGCGSPCKDRCSLDVKSLGDAD